MVLLTSPSALLALLGLLVPLAIHLWNRRPGQEVAVGSLRWLAAGANRRLRNLRLEQRWLLLLRAALLAVLALALAGPVWRQAQPSHHGQVLVSPALAGTGALASVRPTIDSLRRRGYGLRWLAAGFPLIKAADWQADSAGRPLPLARAAAAAWYWQRVQQAGAAFAGQPLYVLTPAALGGFAGTHPPLPVGLTWLALPTRRAAYWLQSATATPDSLHLVVGHSTEATLHFQRVGLAKPPPPATLHAANLPPLRYTTQLGPAFLQPLATDSGAALPPAVPVGPATVRVWVYAPAAAATEARYLQAALRAAAVGLPGRLALTVAATPPSPATPPDWLFWLASQPLPGAWQAAARRGLRVWLPAAGPAQPDTASLAVPAAGEATPVAIWRRARGPVRGEVLWADSRGRAVLARQPLGAGALYTCATRLAPAWSALPASPAFPALLLDVLAPPLTAASLAAHDQRRLDPRQLPPLRAARASRPPAAFRLVGLRPWLVLAAGFLFALERWLARRPAALTSTLA